MKQVMKVIGKSTPKMDARIKASGRAVYGQDVVLLNMLHGAILRTKFPSAEIMSIDTSKAKRLPGVVCVITADDVDVNNISYKGDHPILKKGEVTTEEEIRRFCRKHMADYKVPKQVIFIDSLPKTATGKIRKEDLRD